MDWFYYIIIGLIAVIFLLVGYFARVLQEKTKNNSQIKDT